MGKRKNQFDENIIWAECKICGKEIELAQHDRRGDMIVCYGCGSEYVIKSRQPVRLELMADDY